MGGLGAGKHAEQAPALVKDAPAKQSGKGRLAVIVKIVTCRHRVLDSDNHVSGCKPMRDAIARSLAIDDGSERIQFEYSQLHTTGPERTIVVIEWV